MGVRGQLRAVRGRPRVAGRRADGLLLYDGPRASAVALAHRGRHGSSELDEQRSERAPQLAHAGEAIGRVLRERLHRDVVDARIEVGATLRGPRRGYQQVLAEERLRFVGDEGRLSGHQLVEHRAACVYVAAFVDLLAEALLGGHVRGRSGERRTAAVGHRADDAEVTELHVVTHLAVVVGATHEDDVRRLHVSVDDVMRVGVRETCGDLEHDLDGALHGETRGGVEDLGERRSHEELHREPERPLLLLAEVEHAHEVRMIEEARGAALGVEARAHGRVPLERRMDHLHGDVLREVHVLRAIDGAERTEPDALVHEQAATERTTDERVVDTRSGTKRGRRRRDLLRCVWSLSGKPVHRAGDPLASRPTERQCRIM